MDLLLVRHGQPERVDAEHPDAEPADPGLTAQGHLEAKNTAEWLRGETIDHIVSSPLLRARETAIPLADALGLGVEIHDDLAEYDRNAPHYIPLEQMVTEDHEQITALVEGRWEDYGGENPAEFADRVLATVEGIIERHEGQRVVAFCHGGVINAYLAHVIQLDRPLWFYPEYGSIHRVAALHDGIRMLVSLNELPRS
ncbi:MAG: histidine phosphatase family protein [Acidimicrobiia bacterium]|nr:histidine phosphatase family protein [Acidimicrobiia bacterium]